MPNNKYDYTVKINADIGDIKKDIKSAFASALREADNVGDAISKGITPDTRELEIKIASLESEMNKLQTSAKDVEQQVSSMKTAFRGFVELEAAIKVISEQNKTMYETFVNMTPYLHEFAKTFMAMKPEQAGAAFESVMKNANASGQAGSQAFKDMQVAAQQASNTAKSSIHEIETAAVSGATAINGVVETTGRSIQDMKNDAKDAVKELERLQEIRRSYGSDKDYSGKEGQRALQSEIKKQKDAFYDLQGIFEELSPDAANYNQKLVEVIESGQKLLALVDKLDKKESKTFIDSNYFDAIGIDVKEYIKEFENTLTTVSTQISKVELKPIKLKVDLADSDEIKETINKRLNEIQEKVKFKSIRIPIEFYDPDEELKKLEKKKKALENAETVDEKKLQETIDKEAYDKTLASLQKKVDRVQKAFNEAKGNLLKDLQDFKKESKDALNLQFTWGKSPNDIDEIQELFDIAKELAMAPENKIPLYVDTNDFIEQIQNALKEHKFEIKLEGDSSINATIVNGGGSGVPMRIKRQASAPLATSAPSTPKRQGTDSQEVEEKKNTDSVKANSTAVDSNTDAINSVVQVFQRWINQRQREMTSGNQKSINNAQARIDAMKSILGVDVTTLSGQQLTKAVEDMLKCVDIADILSDKTRSGFTNDKGQKQKLVTDKFLETIKSAQSTMGVSVSTSAQEDLKYSSKEMYDFAESLTRLGNSLVRVDLDRNFIPFVQSLAKTADIFAGTAFSEVSPAAKDLENAVREMEKKFANGGTLQGYLKELSSTMDFAQGTLSSTNATDKERKDAQARYDSAAAAKQEIYDYIKPFADAYKQARNEASGEISSLLSGFKFKVEIEGEDPKYFNYPQGGKFNIDPYYSRYAREMNSLKGKNVTGYQFSGTINESAMKMVYGDSMTKQAAVSSILSAYDKLDDKFRDHVNSFITGAGYTVEEFLDASTSINKKWEIIKDSFINYDKREGMQVNPNIGGKYKNVINKADVKTTLGSFLGALEEAKEGVYAIFQTSRGKQEMLMRGGTKNSATQEIPIEKPASQREYQYTKEARAYRTATEYKQLSVDEVNTKLKENEVALTKANTDLARYSQALEQVEQSHKEEKTKLDTTAERKELQKKYSGITDSQSFQTQYNMSEQEVKVLRDIVAENTKKAESANNSTNQLYADLQENKTLISSIQTRIEDVKNAGGVQSYLDQLNSGISEYKTLEKQIIESEKELHKYLETAKYSLDKAKDNLDKGVITQKEYDAQKKAYELQKEETETVIAENNEILKSEQEKYAKLVELRKSFTSEISKYDKDTDSVYQLSDEEYYAKKSQDLVDAQKKNAEIQQAVSQSENVLAEANSKLQSTKSQLEAEEKNLEQMRVAFAEYYYQYVNQLLRETSNEISKIEDAQKTGNLKKLSLDENSANEKLSALKERSRYYSSESSRFSSILNPETGYETRIESAKKRLTEAQDEVTRLEEEKTRLEQSLYNIENGVEIPNKPAPVESMTNEQKELYVTQEVKLINLDLETAKGKIKEIEDKKTEIEAKIANLEKYKDNSWLLNGSKASATKRAREYLSKNSSEYQELIKQLDKDLADKKITRAEYSTKEKAFVDKFKASDKSGQFDYTHWEDYKKTLQETATAQDEIIRQAKEKQAELDVEKKKALEILGITEEQLFAQKEITKNKQEQNDTTTPSPTTASQSSRQQSSSTSTQDVERRVEGQSNNIDSTFVAKIDAKLADNDKKIAELQAKVGTGSKASPTKKFKEYFVSARSKTIGDAADRLNRDFYNTLKQGPKNKKGQTLADFSDTGNIDAIIKKARELRSSLHQMYSDGKEGSKEFLIIQQQLTDLLERTRKNVSKTDLANGYEKNQDKTMSKKAWTKFLTDRGAGDLTKFTGTKYNLNSSKNISSAILTDDVQATINGLSEEYQQAAIKAYTDAFNAKKASLKNSGKNKGQIENLAKNAALKAFDEFIRTQKDGFVAGTQEGANSPETETAKVKLAEEIRDIEEENRELKDLRERYIKGMLSEEDNDLLASFVADSVLDENQVGTMMQRAAEEAKNSVDKTGKTESQIADETKELFKKKLFSMLTAVIGGARQGVEEADEDFEEPSSGSSISYGGQGYVGEGGYVQLDGITIQAGNVVVNGNTVGTSSDGTGPWALETTLQRTNEILNSISGKIDSVKGSSGSSNGSPASGETKKQKKTEEINVNAIRQRLESEAADNRKRFSIDGLEDSIKSVQKFDEKTLKLYETFTLANGEAVKFTYSLNTMDGTIKSSYTTIANFEGVAKKAYTELGKSQIATKQLFEGFNFPQDKITAYNNAISALDNKLKSLGENGITDPKDANEVEVLTGNVKKLRTEIENMVKASEKTTNNGTFVKKFNADEVDNVKASMKALAEEIPNASLATSNFNDKTNELTFTVKTGRNELTTLTYKFDELTQSVYETGKASKTTTGFFKSFFSDVGTKVAELARYYTGMSLLTEGLQQVRRGVQYVREIDLALTELKKVTDETDAAYTKFLQNMSKTASVVGSTTSELTNSAADGLIS